MFNTSKKSSSNKEPEVKPSTPSYTPQRTETRASSTDTVISKEIIITGDIKGDTSIRIEGKVEGNIEVKKKIVIGSSGKVKGNLDSENVEIQGFVLGNVSSKDLRINSSGKINGDIHIEQLSIDMGGIHNGSTKMEYQKQKDNGLGNLKAQLDEQVVDTTPKSSIK